MSVAEAVVSIGAELPRPSPFAPTKPRTGSRSAAIGEDGWQSSCQVDKTDFSDLMQALLETWLQAPE